MPTGLKMKNILSLLCFLAGTFCCGADMYKFSLAPITGDEQAVLVLAPGMNDNGEYFLGEEPWADFAKKNGLGIVALNFSSSVEDLNDGKGYWRPELGSGQALLDEVKRAYGKDLPLILYGFSGGAIYIGRFIDWAPDRIIAWCAYSVHYWDEPKDADKGTKARGIVACGDLDGGRWYSSLSFFYKGRQKNRP